MIEEADYVIVGAGTAGCVVASRLSEDPWCKVALLEAGGSDLSIWIQLPIGYGRTFFDPRINWMFDTQPIAGLGGRSSYWPRGKVVGGSGSINAMVHVRGFPQDFRDWRAAGNLGWDWDDVLPWFIRTEDHDLGPSERHGAGGPQHVTDISARVHPLCNWFLNTGRELGYPVTPDFNGLDGEGFGIYQITTRGGWRASTANAYYHPVRKRPNLHLIKKAHATRIVFEGRKAVGVAYRKGGRERIIRARREVILCAGAIGSPQLLQLSGVGDPALLQDKGIPVVQALPAVGRNLQDHLAVSYFYRTSVPTLNNVLGPFSGKLLAGLRYLFDRRGPLSMSVNQAGGFVRGNAADPHPTHQLYFSPVSYTRTPIAARRLLNPDPFPAFLLSFNACRPTSRGHLEITTADPFAKPAIHPNYLATDHDVEQARIGVRLLRTIVASAPLSDIITEELVPGAEIQGDEALLADFRERADTVYHPTSTCIMGPDPATSVVDNALRVHGIGGLRVIDASIFPTVTSGNTNAPTVMVAEKGAALVKLG
ncbi:GMC family oxidoreductase [Novosphingobium sp. FKTRR1]|uniref:GMC family oxidoreductase n=1 Tax=unclassified Novosphingobium TaxID=2644732 RepID=UPI001CF07C37|nr:GMC family oxidoreductase N-terminal domain-containing protein [Novosphingobium sp. FKTRR1]